MLRWIQAEFCKLRRRPMKLDASAGRLPDRRVGLAIVESNLPRPQATEAGRYGIGDSTDFSAPAAA
jgi:hypothetical protein